MYFGNFRWPTDVPMTRLRSRVLIFGLCVAAGLPATMAHAQTPPNLSAVPVGSPLPRIMPPAAPEVGPGLVAPAPHPLHNPLPGAQVQVSSAELLGATVAALNVVSRNFNSDFPECGRRVPPHRKEVHATSYTFPRPEARQP